MNRLSSLSGLKLALQKKTQHQTDRHFSNILSKNKISSAGGAEGVALPFPYPSVYGRNKILGPTLRHLFLFLREEWQRSTA